MKKTILIFMVLIFSAVTFSCSSDADSGNTNDVYHKLIGKWYFQDPSVYGYETNNSFTFNSNNTVRYSTWASANDERGETGTWSINGNILTMEYPQTFLITYIQKVVFIDENTIQFIKAEGLSEEPYEGTYYKAE